MKLATILAVATTLAGEVKYFYWLPLAAARTSLLVEPPSYQRSANDGGPRRSNANPGPRLALLPLRPRRRTATTLLLTAGRGQRSHSAERRIQAQ